MATVKELIKQAESRLDDSNKDVNVAKVLFYHLANKEPHELYLMYDEEVDKDLEKQFLMGMEEYYNGRPIQYIKGVETFFGRDFKVNENVLIPRFETETLVEKTINYAKELTEPLDILDIGTGSGAIAITLAKHLSCHVLATDISEEALEIAKINSKRNNVQIDFKQSDILKNVQGKFDIIISNPPYIAKDEVIDPLVKDNEPHLALYAEEDGLYFYRNILENVKPFLKEKSLIAFEIGMTQSAAITKIAQNYLPHAKIITEKDLTGKDRYIFIFNNF